MRKLNEDEKKYFKDTFFIITGGIIINALCFLLYFFPSKAASAQEYQYFPQSQNYNGYDFQSIHGAIVANSNIDLDIYDYKLDISSNYQGYYAGWLILSDGYLYAEIGNTGKHITCFHLVQIGFAMNITVGLISHGVMSIKEIIYRAVVIVA